MMPTPAKDLSLSTKLEQFKALYKEHEEAYYNPALTESRREWWVRVCDLNLKRSLLLDAIEKEVRELDEQFPIL